jgi:hypothetical protein
MDAVEPLFRVVGLTGGILLIALLGVLCLP